MVLVLALLAPHALAQKTSVLQGRARESRTRMVVGANVRVQPQGDLTRWYLTTTDAEGAFRVPGLANGLYDVQITREGYRAEMKSGVEVKFPFRAVVEVAMELGTDGPTPPPVTPASRSEIDLAEAPVCTPTP